jgi:hypothetical protein
MPETRRAFDLGTILTVTTGCLLSPKGMTGVYEILNWMTGDNLFTHQLPRASRECEQPLLDQHPDLAAIEIPAWPESVDRATVEAWLAEQVARFGATRDVAPLAADDHTRIDPVTEMQQLKPGGFVVGIVPPEAPHA